MRCNAGLRAGGSDSRAGARAGSDAAPSRRGLPCRRSRAAATRRSPSRRTSSSTTASCRARAGADAPARRATRAWTGGRARRAQAVLDFVRERGAVAPARGRRAFLARHGHATTGAARRARRRICWTTCTTAACCGWRGARAASASTRRASSERTGSTMQRRRARIDALVDVVVAQVRAAAGVRASIVVGRLRYAVPQWRGELEARSCARAKRLAQRASTASSGTGRRVKIRAGRAAAGDDRAPARAVRSRRLGSRAIRAALGLGVPVRGLHAARPSASSATTRCRCSGATA